MKPSLSTHPGVPQVAWGLSSVALGAIGLILFIVPILSLPISFIGALLGIIGIGISLAHGLASLRLSVAGLLLSGCSLAIVASIAIAPGGYFTPRSVFPTLQPGRSRPYIPPPAPAVGGNRPARISKPIEATSEQPPAE